MSAANEVSRSQLIEALVDQMFAAQKHPLGVAGLMLDAEIAAGGEPYPTDAADWVQPSVVVRRGSEVRIVAVLAQRPGNGALSRLVARIRADGLSPVLVEPCGAVMPAILKRWGWKGRMIGWGFEDRMEEWRPVGGAVAKPERCERPAAEIPEQNHPSTEKETP